MTPDFATVVQSNLQRNMAPCCRDHSCSVVN